jgi:hypothetical protein
MYLRSMSQTLVQCIHTMDLSGNGRQSSLAGSSFVLLELGDAGHAVVVALEDTDGTSCRISEGSEQLLEEHKSGRLD